MWLDLAVGEFRRAESWLCPFTYFFIELVIYFCKEENLNKSRGFS